MRVIVADDSLLFREGLARVLSDLGFDVIAHAGNPDDLTRRVGGLAPDVALMDIRLPPTFTDEGLHAARMIGEQYPNVGLVVLSQHVETSYATRLLEERTPGRGYLLKNRVGDLRSFGASIRRVASGGSVFDPEVISAVVRRNRERGPLDQLTEREREILALMAQGRSNLGICGRLELSPRTVESHVRTIFQKLDLAPAHDDHRRVLAVLTNLRTQAHHTPSLTRARGVGRIAAPPGSRGHALDVRGPYDRRSASLDSSLAARE